MAKLTDDPKVAALVEKTRVDTIKAFTRTSVAIVKKGLADRAAEAKEQNNRDGARRMLDASRDIQAELRQLAA